VHISWKLLSWPVPGPVLHRMKLRLEPPDPRIRSKPLSRIKKPSSLSGELR
jgi:hypothetical protein